MTDKIQKLIDRLASFSGMNEAEKQEVLLKLNQGLVLNLLSDGVDIVSKEIIEKMEAMSKNQNPNQEEFKTTIEAYLKEISEHPNGPEIISKRLVEVMTAMIDPIKDKLSEDQKQELLQLLKNNN